MKIRLDPVGLYFVLLLMVLVPLHQEVSQLVSYYYREMFGLVFIVLLFMHRPSEIYRSMFNRRVYVEISLLLLFPLLIVVTAMVDPMVNLYGSDLSEILSSDTKVNPKLYVFRNVIIYLPMLLYIAVRGLSPSDINKIAVFSALIAPVSIVIYMVGLDDYSMMVRLERFVEGKTGISYNSYVPYLTFSVLSFVYLLKLDYKKHMWPFKIVLCLLLLFVLLFILYSTSRQAMLLAVFYIVVFYFRNLSLFMSELKKVLYFIILFVGLYYAYEFFTMEYGENYKLTAQLTGGLAGGSVVSRFEVWMGGISMLDSSEFFTGAGLTSVLVSGPHNDYIRWLQRVGLIIMLISFFPYFSVLFKSYIDVISYKQDKVNLYILCAVIFTLYHSIFGYPREDAYQAIWCFLGISMWLGYHNYRRRKILWKQSNRTLE